MVVKDMFYEQFDKICRKNGETPASIVKQLGLSTSKTTAWKKGSIPKAEILKMLAGTLGVSVADFFAEEGDVIMVNADKKSSGSQAPLLAINRESIYERVKAMLKVKGESVENNFNLRFGRTIFENLSNWERARNCGIDAKVLVDIADYFNVTVDWLARGTDTALRFVEEEKNSVIKQYEETGDMIHCPHCGETYSDSNADHREKILSFELMNSALSGFNISNADSVNHNKYESVSLDTPFIRLRISRCKNAKCKKYSVVVTGVNENEDTVCGYGNDVTFVYPNSDAKPVPTCVSAHIKKDYEEACAVRHISTKAAATLCRRCLHSMIIDFFEMKEDNQQKAVSKYEKSLKATRKELEKIWDNQHDEMRRFLSPLIMESIPGFCRIGDKATHEDAVSCMIFDDEEQAKDLVRDMISFIEDRFTDWYGRRDNERSSYGALSEKGREITAAEETEVAAEKAATSKQTGGIG
jgi:transcriptional regulator with XRE-family HTH domain